MSRAFVAFDLETTGLSAKTDRIIEVGAVRFTPDGEILGRLELIVDPGIPIPLAIQRLVGLGDDDVAGAISPVEAVAQLADFAAGAALVAHGAEFDLAYVGAVSPRALAGMEVFDTLELARILLPAAPSHSLPLLTGALGIGHDRPHRALSDAEATAELFAHLITVASGLPRPVLTRMRAISSPLAGGLGVFLREVVPGDGRSDLPEIAGGSVVPRRAAVTAGEAGSLEDRAAALLGPSGPLAGDDYEYRDAQIEMTRAVAQTVDRHGRLVVEAGTGVGKSLAYLGPILLDAVRADRRAVVATYTITLQEQLFFKDAPRLVAAIEPRPDVAMLKGRQHYLSLRRWERFIASAPLEDADTIRFALKILVWLGTTRTGDRAELRLSAHEEGLWRRVRSDSGDCLGGACANWGTARCFMVAARRTAAQADVVITNHALLLSDSERQGTVLDHYATLIVDEAHRLEEAATQNLGVRVRAGEVLDALERLPLVAGSEAATAVANAAAAVRRLFGEIKGSVTAVLGNDNAANGAVALTAANRGDASIQPVIRSAEAAVHALRAAAAALDGAPPEDLTAGRLPQPARGDEERALAAGSARDAAAAVERVVGGPREGDVAWLELRAEHGELHAAPVDVAGDVHDSIVDARDSVVLTSATLSVAGDFGFITDRLGVRGAQTLVVDSPFDYLRQALTLLPADIPPYEDPRHDEHLARLVRGIALRIQGRTMVLFTGYAQLRRAHGLLDRWLAADHIAVLGQGIDGTRRQVLESFLANPRSVLLGTASFWEGIDIPGDALRCVVIAKLPFAVPTDPLVRARCDHLSDPFGQYILPLAVLRLKQGFGRLIRRTADRGVVVIGDARLGTRDYAAAFLRALPPAATARVPAADIPALAERFIASGALPDTGLFTRGRTEDAELAMIESFEPHSEEPA